MYPIYTICAYCVLLRFIAHFLFVAFLADGRASARKEKFTHPPTPELRTGGDYLSPGRDSRGAKGSSGILLGVSAASKRERERSGPEFPSRNSGNAADPGGPSRPRRSGVVCPDIPTEVTLG